MKSFKVVTLAVAVAGGMAASDASAILTFGLKGGAGLSMDRIEGGEGVPSVGYMGGGSVEVGLGPVGILTDVLYNKSETRIGTSNTYFSSQVASLLIPVQLKISMMGILSFTGGMYWNYGLGEVTNKGVVSGDEVSSDSISYSAAHVAKSSVGAIAGIGVGIPLGMAALSAEARVRYGFTDMATTSAITAKTLAFDLLVGVTF